MKLHKFYPRGYEFLVQLQTTNVWSWTRNSSDSDVKGKIWQSKRSLKWILTSDSESTVRNLPRKLKHIRNYRLAKKMFGFYWESLDWRNTNTPKIWKLRNAIIWLSVGCVTWNFQNILTTVSSKCTQNFKSFWSGDVFGSVKWYGIPQ